MQNNINAIDSHIGKRARQRRVELEFSLEEVSLNSGISIAELHRIEEGKAKVTAAQLFNLANALHISPGSFFETQGLH